MALRVARGGQSPDLKPSHTNHFLMTQGTEEKAIGQRRYWSSCHAAPTQPSAQALGDSQESGLPHQTESAIAQGFTSPLFLFWGLDQ